MSPSFSVVLEYPALGYIMGRVHGADEEGFEMTSVPVHLPRGARVFAALLARGVVVARVEALAYPGAHGLTLKVAAQDLATWCAVRRGAGRALHCAAPVRTVPLRRAYRLARELLRA